MSQDYSLHRGGGEQLLDMLTDVTDLYLAIRAEPPYDSGPLYRRELFLDRTRGQAERDGFTFAWAVTDNDRLIGFAFGYPFPANSWWSGNASKPPPKILSVAKFAVIELDVDAHWRSKGIGARLLDHLLDQRPEPYAILTTRPDVAARRFYERLGWHQTGTAQHAPDAPVFDQLAIRLPLQHSSTQPARP